MKIARRFLWRAGFVVVDRFRTYDRSSYTVRYRSIESHLAPECQIYPKRAPEPFKPRSVAIPEAKLPLGGSQEEILKSARGGAESRENKAGVNHINAS